MFNKWVFSFLALMPVLCLAQSPATLGAVHDRLKLSNAQEPYWESYVARIDAYTQVFYQEKPASALTGDTAPRQIARTIDNMQNRLAVLDEVERSAKALYAMLDASQKETADQSLLATIPVFGTANCPPMLEGKGKNTKPDGAPHKRHGGGMGGPDL
jgi:hypothetical protein